VRLERANNAMPEKGDTVRLESQTIREVIFQGAIQGAIVWTVYAIVECGFASILPWIVKPHYDYIPLHWGFTVLLFGLYPTLGLILGGLCGLGLSGLSGQKRDLAKSDPTILFTSLATLGLVLAFDVNLVLQWSFSRSVFHILPPLSISLILAIILALSVWSRVWFERLRFAANPWSTSLLLIGLPWISVELLRNEAQATKAWSVLAYLVVIFLISFFVQKMLRTRPFSKSPITIPVSRARVILFRASVALLVLGISFLLHQEPYRVAQKLKPLTQNPGRPNIILITLDTVRADHLSLYGYKRDTTPNLKKFSEEGVLYTYAVAPGCGTLTTHASIFTGLYVKRHGAYCDFPQYPHGRPLADRFHTVAEIFSEKDYLTLGIVANYAYLSYYFGLDQGFQHYDQRSPVPFLAETQSYYLRQGVRNILTCFASPSDFDQLYRRAEDINQEVFTLLEKLKKNDIPFFLFINYMDAHSPYIPPPPFDKFYPGKISKKFTMARYREIRKEVLKFEHRVAEEERNHLVSQYDGGITYIDFQIGKLITRLKDLGLYENCLIIITSDHGEAFGERNLFQHGVSVYQDQIYVPLIIKYPNISRGVVVNEPVSLCDLMPTILDILGYGIPGDIDGQSLLRLKHSGSREVISESYTSGSLREWHLRFRRVERAIFSGQFKFISSTAGKRELYDLSKDPDEKENLYNGNGGISKELEVTLNRWLSEVREESGSPVKLDKEALDRLKSLGYIK